MSCEFSGTSSVSNTGKRMLTVMLLINSYKIQTSMNAIANTWKI